MAVFANIEEMKEYASGASLHLALGSFDGIHIGHQALFDKALSLARERGGSAAVLLLDPHPAKVVGGSGDVRMLTTLEEKIRWIGLYGDIDIFILPFDLKLAAYSPEDFVRRCLIGIFNIKTAIIGHNYRFGAKKSGNAETLDALSRDLGFDCHIAPLVTDGLRAVSSTHIRRLIETGATLESYEGLGHCHVFRGDVVAGDRIGSSIGYPTANLRIGEDSIWPGMGVYGGFSMDDKGNVYKSVVNVGVRPTVADGRDISGPGAKASFEVHLFGFSGDLYDRKLRVILGGRIREEARFSGLSALKDQIAKDSMVALASLEAWEKFLSQKELTPASLFTCFMKDFPL